MATTKVNNPIEGQMYRNKYVESKLCACSAIRINKGAYM